MRSLDPGGIATHTDRASHMFLGGVPQERALRIWASHFRTGLVATHITHVTDRGRLSNWAHSARKRWAAHAPTNMRHNGRLPNAHECSGKFRHTTESTPRKVSVACAHELLRSEGRQTHVGHERGLIQV